MFEIMLSHLDIVFEKYTASTQFNNILSRPK